jgi:hypothetical protein
MVTNRMGHNLPIDPNRDDAVATIWNPKSQRLVRRASASSRSSRAPACRRSRNSRVGERFEPSATSLSSSSARFTCSAIGSAAQRDRYSSSDSHSSRVRLTTSSTNRGSPVAASKSSAVVRPFPITSCSNATANTSSPLARTRAATLRACEIERPPIRVRDPPRRRTASESATRGEIDSGRTPLISPGVASNI